MRDQYAGDISDLLKFALLRALAGEDQTLGVGWYYNPGNDGRRDGRHREYLDEHKWEKLDRELWEVLQVSPPQSVKDLEQLPIWPKGTRFHAVPVPPKSGRESWTKEMKAALDGCSLVFLDPDNGVGSTKRDAKLTKRHATLKEIEALRQPGRAMVLIKFPGRVPHDVQVKSHHSELSARLKCSSLVTLWTSVQIRQPKIRWFTIIDGDEGLLARARRFRCALKTIEGCGCKCFPEDSSDC